MQREDHVESQGEGDCLQVGEASEETSLPTLRSWMFQPLELYAARDLWQRVSKDAHGENARHRCFLCPGATLCSQYRDRAQGLEALRGPTPFQHSHFLNPAPSCWSDPRMAHKSPQRDIPRALYQIGVLDLQLWLQDDALEDQTN